jgi:hypothetical protein
MPSGPSASSSDGHPPFPHDHGPLAWAHPGWLRDASAWLDDRLAAAGLARTGDVERAHLRPWSVVLRAPTTGGTVWLKAANPTTRFEPALSLLLSRVVGDLVLAPIAIDSGRGFTLLPDGGPVLGEQVQGAALADAFARALVAYGRLQRALEPHVDTLLELGVPDMRPAALPERFAEALAIVGAQTHDRAGRAKLEAVAALEPSVLAWCDALAASPLSASIDHNDLHPGNLFADGRFFDWADSVVAHPLAAMLVPLRVLERMLADTAAPAAALGAILDPYLDVFADRAPREELVSILPTACRVAKIARALGWERALAAAQAQGIEVEEQFSAAAAQTLFSLLEPAHAAAH